jgi:hypothetical protein
VFELFHVDLEGGSLMADDDDDGEDDVKACAHAHQVYIAKYRTKDLVVIRREGGLIGTGGGVNVTVLALALHYLVLIYKVARPYLST